MDEQDRINALMEVNELLGKAKEQKRCLQVLMSIAEDTTYPMPVREAMLFGINKILDTDK